MRDSERGGSQRDFDALYVTEHFEDPEFQKSVELWERYFQLCDAYDNSICTRFTPGGRGIPTTDWERKRVNAHAKRVYDMTVKRLRIAKVPDETIHAGRKFVLSHSRS